MITNLFFEENSAFNFNVKLLLMETDLEFDSFFEDAFVESSEESVKKVFKLISNMIRKLISSIKDFKNAIIKRIEELIAEKNIVNQLNNLKKDIEQAARKGTTIKFIDVYAYENCLKEYSSTMQKVCDSYMEGLSKGKSMLSAKLLFVRIEHIEKKFTTRLDEIKSNYKEENPTRVLLWIEKNINKKGEVIGIIDDYIKTLDKYRKEIEKISNRVTKYAADNGYIETPRTFTHLLNNSAAYIQKNLDWILMYSLSTSLLLIKIGLNESDINDLDKKMKTQYRTASLNDEDRYSYARGKQSSKTYWSSKKVASMVADIGAVGTSTLATEMKKKSKKNNSI